MATAKSLGAWIGLFALGLVLVFTVAIIFGLMRIPLMDIQREGTQRTQQYVETQQGLLLTLITDYEQAEEDSGRQISIKNRICQVSTLIQPSEYPPSVAQFVSTNCR